MTPQAALTGDQIDYLVTAGYLPITADMNFIVEGDDHFFEVQFRLSNGHVCQFVADRGGPRRYRNPVHFLQWAKRHGIERVQLLPVNVEQVFQQAS